MLKIDSHQHFWQVARGDYGWLTPELSDLYRDFLPDHLQLLLGSNHVNSTILVQAADTVEETEFMLALAEQHEFIQGVVGWVDMESNTAVKHLRLLSKNDYFKGIRPMIQDIADPDWMLQPELTASFKALIDLGLTFDALVLPQHLANLKILARRYPELKIVIDHGAKPHITKGLDAVINQQWAADMQELAGMPNVHCKLSGLLTEAAESPTYETIRPFMEHLLTCFGNRKLLWGSDWPVLNLASDYDTWCNMVEQFVAPLEIHEQQAIWLGNAQSFYNL